jgi:hypothetical protein
VVGIDEALAAALALLDGGATEDTAMGLKSRDLEALLGVHPKMQSPNTPTSAAPTRIHRGSTPRGARASLVRVDEDLAARAVLAGAEEDLTAG